MRHCDLTPEQRRRANCRSYTNTLIKRGTLVPQPCEVCGSSLVQPHHEDYDKPREVRWLCKAHHKDEHHPPNARRSDGPCARCAVDQRVPGQAYCKACHAEDMRLRRAAARERGTAGTLKGIHVRLSMDTARATDRGRER